MMQLFSHNQKIKGPNRLSMWVTDEISKDAAVSIFSPFPDPFLKALPSGAILLKQARQRLVYRIDAEGLPADKAVVKMFPLKNPISWLKYRKYAHREFINYHHARARKVAVPKIYAYVQKRTCGFVTGSGIIVECLNKYRDLMDIATHSPQGYSSAAKMGIPALVALYNAGAMHIDARDENIFIADTGNPQDFSIIDWQYARFHKPRSEWMLEHLAAYYIRNAPDAERRALCSEWLLELHQTAQHDLAFEQFSNRVHALLGARQSVRARLALRPAKTLEGV